VLTASEAMKNDSGGPESSSAQVLAFLREGALRELIVAGAITDIVAKGGNGGFTLELRLGERSAVLSSSRGEPRLFGSINTIAVVLQKLGYPCFAVDATDYVPGRIRAAQPNRSAAMKSGRLPAPSKTTNKEKKST
jgi:hypothetical protein